MGCERAIKEYTARYGNPMSERNLAYVLLGIFMWIPFPVGVGTT